MEASYNEATILLLALLGSEAIVLVSPTTYFKSMGHTCPKTWPLKRIKLGDKFCAYKVA